MSNLVSKQLPKTLLLCLLLGGAGSILHAEPVPGASPRTEPLPQPPFIKDAPDNSTWTVALTFKHPPASPAPGGPPQHLLKARQIVKAGGIKRETTVYADGKQTQTWYVNNIRLREDEHGHYIEVLDLKTVDRGNVQGSHDFDELAWLAAKFYQNVATEGKGKYYLYQVDVQVDPNNPRPGTGGRYQALVDVDTRLPLRAEDLDFNYTYHYEAAPAGTLTLPPAFQQEYDKYLAAVKTRKVTHR